MNDFLLSRFDSFFCSCAVIVITCIATITLRQLLHYNLGLPPRIQLHDMSNQIGGVLHQGGNVQLAQVFLPLESNPYNTLIIPHLRYISLGILMK